MGELGLSRADVQRLLRRGRAVELVGKFVQGVATRTAANALAALLNGWLLMLGVGVLHDNWWSSLPTIGYWTSVLAVFLLGGTLSRLPDAKKSGAS